MIGQTTATIVPMIAKKFEKLTEGREVSHSMFIMLINENIVKLKYTSMKKRTSPFQYKNFFVLFSLQF